MTVKKPQAPEKWLKEHTNLTKASGSLFLTLAFVMFIVHYGLAAGIFMAFIFLMTGASLIIILKPLQLISYKNVASIFIVALIVEILIK